MSVEFWLFLVNTAISTVQKSLLPILDMHWYLTILYAMCIGSCPTAMLQKHILYLLKWTLRLQLFSHFFCPTLTPPGMAERVLPPDGFLLPGGPGKTCTFSKQLQLASLGQDCSYNLYCSTSVL